MQTQLKAAPRMERTRHPGIYKRGSRYVVVWRHKGRQHKSFHRTLGEAREAQGERRRTGDRAPASRRTLEDYALEWIDSYQGRTARGFTEASRAAYRRALEVHALPFFRGARLADVELADVRAFVHHLETSGLSPASVVKTLVPLKAMFATALENGAVRVNPTLGVRVNRRRDEPQEEAEAKALTRAELARVLGELPEEWWLFFELLTHTGLRVSEAIGLTWGDVEFGARSRVRVRRQHYRGETKRLKSRNGRRDLPLSTGLARRLWPLRGAPEALLFATRAGTPLHDGNLRRRVLRPAAERAGVPWVGFHTFRHTCASLLFAGGKDIKQVSGWLGHADPAFTLRTYVHLMDEGLGEADFLDDAVTVGNAGATGDPAKAASSAPVEVAM